jgi:hypothetical protein
MNPHKDTRIVVSCLPDERVVETGQWLYCYGCDTRLKEAKIARVTVPLFEKDCSASNGLLTVANIEMVISQLLTKASRTLTRPQLDFVISKACEEPTALYLSLAVRVVREWTSSMPTDACMLNGTVVGLISQLFDSLESNYGVMLTRSALTLLTHAVDGLRDVEMEDLLSLNDDVLQHVFEYHESSVARLPIHVWMRLRDGLEGLLVQGRGGSLRWYHRQLREVAELRYAGVERRVAQGYMAVYFGNLVSIERQALSLISHQPITLNDKSVWSEDVIINQRRCVEASWHMLASGKWKEACDEICNLENICAVLKCDDKSVCYSLVRNVVSLYSEVQRLDEGGGRPSQLTRRVNDYMRFLQGSMSRMLGYANPAESISVVCTSTQPIESIARQDIYKWIRETPTSTSFWRGKSLGGRNAFTPLQMSLEGHTNALSSVAISSDGTKIVSGSWDNTVKVWDAVTGSVLSTLKGHTEGVSSVVMVLKSYLGRGTER